MATVTSLGRTSNTTAGNKTLTVTPALADLIVVIAFNTGRTVAQSPVITDDNSDGAGQYELIALGNPNTTKNTSTDSAWFFIRKMPIGSATSTIFTMATSADTGGGLEVVSIAGMGRRGLNSVRQFARQVNQTTGTPTVVMPAEILSTNPCIGIVMNAVNPAGMAAPASWSLLQDAGYDTPTTGYWSGRINSGETLQTVTWGSAGGADFCASVIELNATLPPYKPADVKNFIYLRKNK